jgi:hypothetical protein
MNEQSTPNQEPTTKAEQAQQSKTKETPAERIADLKKRQAQIAAQIKALEQKDNAKKREADTRLKVLIGAAVLADIDKTASENAEAGEKQKKDFKDLLNRAIQRQQDIEFLTSVGWL